MKYDIGIDLGGTNIKAGVVNENYEIIAKATTKTNCPRPAKEIADDMAKLSVEAAKNAAISIDDVEWIGIDTPGIADNVNGTIPYSNNLGFENVPIRKYIQEHLNKPVHAVEKHQLFAAYKRQSGKSRAGTWYRLGKRCDILGALEIPVL